MAHSKRRENFFTSCWIVFLGTAVILLQPLSSSSSSLLVVDGLIILPNKSKNGALTRLSTSLWLDSHHLTKRNNNSDGRSRNQRRLRENLFLQTNHKKQEEHTLSLKSDVLSSIDDDHSLPSPTKLNSDTTVAEKDDKKSPLYSFMSLTGANDEKRREGVASFLRSRIESRTDHEQQHVLDNTDVHNEVEKNAEPTAELLLVKTENNNLLEKLKSESLAKMKAEANLERKKRELQKSEENLKLFGIKIDKERLARQQAEQEAILASQAKDQADSIIQTKNEALRTAREKARTEAMARTVAENLVQREQENYRKLLDQMNTKVEVTESMEAIVRQNQKKLQDTKEKLNRTKKHFQEKQDALQRAELEIDAMKKAKDLAERLVEEKERSLRRAEAIAKTEAKKIQKKLGREHMARLKAEEETRILTETKNATNALIEKEVEARLKAEEQIVAETKSRAILEEELQAKDAEYHKLLGRLEGKSEEWECIEMKLRSAEEELKNATAQMISAQFQLDKEVAARRKAEEDVLASIKEKELYGQLIKEKEEALCREIASAKDESEAHEELFKKECAQRKKAEEEATRVSDEKEAVDILFQKEKATFDEAKRGFEAKLASAEEKLKDITAQIIATQTKLEKEHVARVKAEEEVVSVKNANSSSQKLVKEKEEALSKEKSNAKADIHVLEQLLERECAARKKAEEKVMIANDAKTAVEALFEEKGASLDKAKQKAEEEAMARLAAEEESQKEKIKPCELLEQLKVEKKRRDDVEANAKKTQKEIQRLEGDITQARAKLEEETSARQRAEHNIEKIKKAKAYAEKSIKPMEEALLKAKATAEETEATLCDYRSSVLYAEAKAATEREKYQETELALETERKKRLAAEEAAKIIQKDKIAAEDKAKMLEEALQQLSLKLEEKNLNEQKDDAKRTSREKIILAETKLKELTKIARAEADARKNAEEKLRIVEEELSKSMLKLKEKERTQDTETFFIQNDYDELEDLEEKLASFKRTLDEDASTTVNKIEDLNGHSQKDEIDETFMFGPQH